MKDESALFKDVLEVCDKLLIDLQSKQKQIDEMTAAIELYYSMTNLKIQKQEDNGYLCHIRGANKKKGFYSILNVISLEIEFVLKENGDDIDYKKKKLNIFQRELKSHSVIRSYYYIIWSTWMKTLALARMK